MLTYCLLKQIGTYSDTPPKIKTNFKYTNRQNFKIVLGFKIHGFVFLLQKIGFLFEIIFFIPNINNVKHLYLKKIYSSHINSNDTLNEPRKVKPNTQSIVVNSIKVNNLRVNQING